MSVYDILVCPKCKGKLETGKEIKCEKCKLKFRVEDDIPILLIEKAEKF